MCDETVSLASACQRFLCLVRDLVPELWEGVKVSVSSRSTFVLSSRSKIPIRSLLDVSKRLARSYGEQGREIVSKAGCEIIKKIES